MKARRTAVFSDVHGNLPALDAVLEDMKAQEVTDYFCLGDIVGYGAEPGECLEKVRALKCPVLKGNHDAAVTGESIMPLHSAAQQAVEYTKKQLSTEQKEYLRGLPLVHCGKRFHAVHASFHEPPDWYYVMDVVDAAMCFYCERAPLLFCGHTHVPAVWESKNICRYLRPKNPFTLEKGSRYLVNPGSVGQPRDGDPRASYLIYESASNRLFFRRVEYDIDRAQRTILEAGLPERLAERLEEGG